MDKVTALKVGQGQYHVAHLDFLFEGKNFLQIGYKKDGDDQAAEEGWGHGAHDVNPKRFQLESKDSRLISPSMMYDNKLETIVAYMF